VPPPGITREYANWSLAEVERMKRGEVPIKFAFLRAGKKPGDLPWVEQVEMRAADPNLKAVRRAADRSWKRVLTLMATTDTGGEQVGPSPVCKSGLRGQHEAPTGLHAKNCPTSSTNGPRTVRPLSGYSPARRPTR
jgi:hypothetical protein